MTLPAALDIMGAAAVAALFLLVLSLRRTVGDRMVRAVALISSGAMAYALADVWSTLPGGERMLLATVGIGMAGLPVALSGWVLYLAACDERPLTTFERAHLTALGVMAVACVVPGLVMTQTLDSHHVALVDVEWTDTRPTPVLGNLVYGLLLVSLLAMTAQSVWRSWRTRTPRHMANAIGLVVLAVVGTNDSIVSSGLFDGPYTIVFGLFAIVGVAGGLQVALFIQDSERVQRLSTELGAVAEERLRELTRKHAQLARAEKLAAIGQLSAGVAHEINNPTAAVMANLDYLREELAQSSRLPEDTGDALADGLVATRRIAGIVRQLLDASRLGSDGSVHRRPVNLKRALDRALTHARVSLPRMVEVQRQVADDVHVLGHEGFVEQILLNLLLNGVHASQAANRPGQLTVRSVLRDGTVDLEVQDDGGGIPPEVAARLFEPFFSTRPGKGTGLGLTVSRGLARSLGGDVLVGATSAEGTTMVLRLPACDAPAPELPAAEPQRAERTELRLLLVDDELLVRNSLSRALKSRMAVETADGPVTALARLAHAPRDFDAVLCDLMMPDGGGARFYREVQAQHPHLLERIVFFTGGATTEEARAFLAEVPNRVLEKPVDSLTLVRAIEEAAARASKGGRA